MNWEITKRESPEFYKARRAAIKSQLGHFWYAGWIMVVVNFLFTRWAIYSASQYAMRLQSGAMWEGWNEGSMYFDVQVLSGAIILGLCAILCGVTWKIERKTSMLLSALGIGAIHVLTFALCFMPIKWSVALISRHCLLSAIVWILFAEVLCLWIFGSQLVVIPELKRLKKTG